MINAKFFAAQVRAGGAPKIGSVLATDGFDVPRIFAGSGAPSSSTLPTGNGKYNAINNGYVTSAGLAAAGSGYHVADVLTITGGTGTALQITVDAVNNTGVIQDWHVATVGAYSVYPTNAAATSVLPAGGTGATLNLNYPPADFYFDVTTPTAPVLYVCTTKGDKTSSVWAIVSGGGSAGLTYYAITSRGTGDYFTAQAVTSITNSSGVAKAHTLSGSNVLIAKQPNMRRSIAQESVDATIYTYTTPGGGDLDNNRSSTDGTNTQAEYCYPRYMTVTEVTATAIYTGDLPMMAQCFIFAQQVTPNAGVIVSSVFLTWQECGPYRVWVAV